MVKLQVHLLVTLSKKRGSIKGTFFASMILSVYLLLVFLRRARRRKDSTDSEKSFAALERMSVRDEKKPSLPGNCSDITNVPVASTSNGAASLTIAQTTKSPVDEDNDKSTATSDVFTPPETTDDDAQISGSETKMVVQDTPQNSENTYAQIDKTRKDFKRRAVSRYEQVLGFGPKLGLVENLTGSDTFMCENDLYAKVTLEPTSKIPEIVNETINCDINDISDEKTENNCECVDSNGSPKEEMGEELKENTHTQLEKNESSLTIVHSNDGNNVTELEEIADKDDSSDEILDKSNVQEKPTEKSRLCAVNSETIMTENMDIYSDAEKTTGVDEF